MLCQRDMIVSVRIIAATRTRYWIINGHSSVREKYGIVYHVSARAVHLVFNTQSTVTRWALYAR